MFEAVLVSLADHGFTPTAIAARLTYYSAPDSLQGAIAAGLLGGGSRFLGVTEDTGLYLHALLSLGDTTAGRRATGTRGAHGAGGPRSRAAHPRPRASGAQRRRPAHPRDHAHRRGEGTLGPHLRLFAAIGRVHQEVLGRNLP